MKTNFLTLFLVLIQGTFFTQNNQLNGSPGTFIAGDIIIQLTENGNVRDILSQSPSKFNLVIFKELSPQVLLFATSSNFSQTNSIEVIAWCICAKTSNST